MGMSKRHWHDRDMWRNIDIRFTNANVDQLIR